jgi:hypothetical protein
VLTDHFAVDGDDPQERVADAGQDGDAASGVLGSDAIEVAREAD